MKRIMLLAAGLAMSALFFAGCNSLPTVQQQFQTGCTIVNGDLAILATSPLLTSAQQQLLTGIPGDASHPGIIAANKAICAAGGQINVANLKEFHDSLLPAAITIAQAIPALPNQQAIVLGLQTFGPMVQALIDQIITAATPSSGASAPVAASVPLAGAPLQ